MEDLPRAMDDRDEWRERVREIRASDTMMMMMMMIGIQPIPGHYNAFVNYIQFLKRYPWCNGYRRRKWTR